MQFKDLIGPTLCGVDPKQGIRLGIELEYENATTRSRVWTEEVPGWNITKDPSLRNGGIEFVSHVTLQEHLHTRLNNVEKMIQKYKLNPHKRCGVHVHMNMTDCTLRDLWCVSVYYALMEPTIFQNFAPDRTDNHFAVPLYYCENMLSAFEKDTVTLRNAEAGLPVLRNGGRRLHSYDALVDFLGPPNTSMNVIRACAKYQALNYRTLAKLGTLEFRHLAATTDFLFIESWCEFLCSLREEALKYNDPNDILDDYATRGVEGLAASLGIMPKEINEQDQEDAEVLALTMGGATPQTKEELDWTIGG